MLSKQKAQLLVEAEISKPDYFSPDLQVEIIDSATIEREWGWVFFYQSAEYLKSGKLDAILAGNAPYIVNKHTGELVLLGTALSVETYIEDYESRLAE
ncbi:hypothetical protein D1BOALGB6SA_2581 [Olavius sp. associated proteobacterium Delta 1]|nr:hypothetical protein D1BOALGB6SA_2581 [Olavius sp. associated proteobacterium Delta 1]